MVHCGSQVKVDKALPAGLRSILPRFLGRRSPELDRNINNLFDINDDTPNSIVPLPYRAMLGGASVHNTMEDAGFAQRRMDGRLPTAYQSICISLTCKWSYVVAV